MVKKSQLQSATVSYIITRTGLFSQPANMRGLGYDEVENTRIEE